MKTVPVSIFLNGEALNAVKNIFRAIVLFYTIPAFLSGSQWLAQSQGRKGICMRQSLRFSVLARNKTAHFASLQKICIPKKVPPMIRSQ